MDLNQANAKHAVTIGLLMFVPIALGISFLWHLHNPKPRVRTPVVINRNSLLPHRFSGPCLNCHRIEEVGPVAMNASNMRLFNLMPQQRRLLQAGQRVDVPSAVQYAQIPAILRDDILPHSFVGVCSNCHIVLAIRPSSSTMRDMMNRAYQPLLGQKMPRERIARGGAPEHDRRELWRNLFGFVALGLFVVSCVYVAMRMLMRADPKKYKGKFDIKYWFKLHEVTSVGFTLSTIVHWYFSDRGNNLLHISLLIAIWLTVAGGTLHYRLAHKQVGKKVRLLHSQRFLFFALIALMVFGHLVAEME